MPHPHADRLRELAARLRADADAADALGEEDVARTLRQQANELDHARATHGRLTDYPKTRRITTEAKALTPAAREAISRRFGGDDPNVQAARAADPRIRSLRDLAARLDVTASFLSQVRAGTKKMPPALAAAFRSLTGRDWQ